MDSVSLIKFASAFVFVICLMLLLSWILKRSGFSGQSMLPSARRRLKIVETLPIDHRRRLAIVRCDQREHLLVLGAAGETVIENNIPAADHISADQNVIGLPVSKEQKNG